MCNAVDEGSFKDIERFENDLWEAADNLRANSKLTSSDYFMPVLGIIFLRHAANRFEAAAAQIAADQAAARMPKRKVRPADYISRRALWLPEDARYDVIMQKAANDPRGLPKLVTEAMKAIEAEFDPLKNILPRDYGIFEPRVLEDLMRLFNSEQIKQATGDVFGRIYEYFLAKFSIQKAHDNGEFFTPSSLVQTIVNVIEPDHGIVLDPACGSGGMFVQSSHFIEHEGGDTAKKVVFYGQEKNRDTIRIAKMNLAVHGLEGKIAEAITYYQDEHELVGKCDFVMANPPFNVDLIDAGRLQTGKSLDPRLPFGLPGVNKQKRVSNGNYVWISYFWSYLGEKGRAGFVMSSQASSAGHAERDVRQKIVESGDVDVMIAIRSNFFYTRTVPCELWFFDRGKPQHLPSTAGRGAGGEGRSGEGRALNDKDHVLMLDARNVFRKINRTINDFSPEQMANLSAIVWLYRGQQDRFLALIERYLKAVTAESAAVRPAIDTFEATLATVQEPLMAFSEMAAKQNGDGVQATAIEAVGELCAAMAPYEKDRKTLLAGMTKCARGIEAKPPAAIRAQHSARESFAPLAEGIKGLVKQIDLVAKLAARAHDQIGAFLSGLSEEARASLPYDRRCVARLLKQLEEHRSTAVEHLRRPVYFHRQAVWLLDRFPEAKLTDVPGLLKLVSRSEINAADWSLTPGRYVGVAPAEVDEDFDFEQAMRDIHAELADLNREAADLASKIQKNFEELGI
jgi:type I restriction enzyme M protein